MLFDLSGKRVWVAGHKGMVGSAIIRRLSHENCELIFDSREKVDLTRQRDVEQFISTSRPDAVFLAAAKVGGIHANSTYPVDFLYNNLMIETNILHACAQNGVEKVLFLGSSCIYPKNAPQPMKEEALLTGALEPTNEWYSIAKIAGIKLCQAYRQQFGLDFISAMPTNLYGPGDNFHLEDSHVPAALLRRFHEAKLHGQKQVYIWGTGKPRREFLFVDDLADATVFLMKNYSEKEPINIGVGKDIEISEFANLVADVVGYVGELVYDTNRPDGAARKMLDIGRLSNLGWVAPTTLRRGMELYYRWFLENAQSTRQ